MTTPSSRVEELEPRERYAEQTAPETRRTAKSRAHPDLGATRVVDRDSAGRRTCEARLARDLLGESRSGKRTSADSDFIRPVCEATSCASIGSLRLPFGRDIHSEDPPPFGKERCSLHRSSSVSSA